ncbi:hypothetical protein EDC04DRAFT_718802 [Pisolithus marmoratus]|nr:hypothetical protein EDC04DRAFT_718802 [Pisolithus marmoratus]
MTRPRQLLDVTLPAVDTSILTVTDGISSIVAATSVLPLETTPPSTSELATLTSDLLTIPTDSPTTSAEPTKATTAFLSASTTPSSTPTSSSIPFSSSDSPTDSPSLTSTTPPGIPTTITSSFVTVIGSSTYTTQSLIPSIIPSQSSPPGIPTTITSSFVTVIGSSTHTTQTLIATVIPSQSSSSSDQRAAIIGGSAAGGAILLVIIVAIIYILRQKHFKRLRILDAIMYTRNQAAKRAMLLAGEDLDDDFYPPPSGHRDYETPWDVRSPPPSMSTLSFFPPGSPGLSHQPSIFPSIRSFGSEMGTPGVGIVSGPSTLSLYQSHRSETGSMFQEDVWPPPSEQSRLIDPFTRSQEIDLGSIVDDVMGPTPSRTSSEDAERQHR